MDLTRAPRIDRGGGAGAPPCPLATALLSEVYLDSHNLLVKENVFV